MRTRSAVVSERNVHIRFTIVVAALLAAVGVLQHRIDDLNQADALYRWLLARQTRMDIGGIAQPTPEENAFFQKVREAGTAELAADIVSEHVTPAQKWDTVRSGAFRELRTEFAELLRDGKLIGVTGVIDWQKEGVGAHLGALILGFRTAVADLLWLKVDEYWHAGDLHRMLPMMYTVVRLDPHFIDAYSIGAWHLAYNAVAAVRTEKEKLEYIQRGIEFLKDGIEKNPFDYRLYFELGYSIYYVKLQDFANAVTYLELANRYDPPVWVQRMLLHAYEKNNQFEKALEGWRRYREQHPENVAAPRFELELEAMIAARDGDEERARALWQQVYDGFPGQRVRADIELTKIHARRAEAEGHDEQALELWRSLIVKRYPAALDDALANIRRLHKKLGLPPLREGDMAIWDVPGFSG